ncbi:MAG TPA: YjzD family protein [Candidatus Limosilactobacillus merdigallinarum]|uniref:YjzD family protein n=1 Tax=Candidatus Limosilactobacillus merdigallinarum TaxID=2838652 RepID=A0A9D2AKQ9_9LACO|nr:YjzD family protein [Candidatus Limosilactobacillus merdigallinarum]
MKYVSGSIVAIIWGAILGAILGYIGGQLESATINYGTAAIIGAIIAFVAANCLYFITSHANPDRKTSNK